MMRSEQPRPTLIAPAWHTGVVVLALAGLSVWSAYSHGPPTFGTASHTIRYATTMATDWVLVSLVWYGLRLRGVTLRSLIGDRWLKPSSILRDFGIAILFLIVSNMVLGIAYWLFNAAPSQNLRNLYPAGTVEVILWVLLAATAGICEEIVFRGYLQTQSAAMLQSRAAGVIVQGLVFGASHGYQGLKYMIMIAVFGCLFGLLAQWRHSLRPGMLAHFLQDGVFGLAVGQMTRS
jgi:uncharacterized protein